MPKSTEEWIRDQGFGTDSIVAPGNPAEEFGLLVL
jgi:hypothetical protein